jgi:hypothetical protein
MEIAALIIAAYAATVSTVLGVLEIRARRSQLILKLRSGTAEIDPAGTEGEVIFMEIVNRSMHPVKAMSLSFEDREGNFAVVTWPFPLAFQLPIQIPARDKCLLGARGDDQHWESRSGSLNQADETELMEIFEAFDMTATYSKDAPRLELAATVAPQLVGGQMPGR